MDKIQYLNVVFAGCAKNCEKYLPKVFENINEYKKLFKSSYTLIVENGSKDKTKEILSTYKSETNLIFLKMNLKINLIEEKIRISEKFYYRKIRNVNYLSTCDLLIILDFDNRSLFKIDNNNIIKAVNFLLSDKKLQVFFQTNLVIIMICGDY